MKQHFQDCNFLFNQTAAKVRHKLFEDSFLVYSVISSFCLLILSHVNDFIWVFFWQKHCTEGLESICVWAGSWCLFGLTQEPFPEKRSVTLLLHGYFFAQIPAWTTTARRAKCVRSMRATPPCVCARTPPPAPLLRESSSTWVRKQISPTLL